MRKTARVKVDRSLEVLTIGGGLLSWKIAGEASTLVQTIVIIATALFAIVSLRQTSRNQRGNALAKLMDDYHSETARADRRHVEQNPLLEFGHISGELQGSYDRLAERFNRIGFMVRNKAVSRRDVLYLYNASILANWIRLKPYIESKRISLGYTNYGRDFETLAGAAETYVLTNFSSGEVERISTEAVSSARRQSVSNHSRGRIFPSRRIGVAMPFRKR